MIKRLFIMLLAMGLLVVGLSFAQTEIQCEEIFPPTDDLSYYVGMGNAYYEQGNFNTAIIVYSCALSVDEAFVPAYVSRGYAYMALGNQAAALEDYNKAIELDANFIPAYINRGNLYTVQGRFGLAITDFDLVIALDSENALAYNNRGVVHAAEGDFEPALADLQQAIALDPSYPAPYAALGVVYSALAVENYAQYRELSGSQRLPSGDADIVIQSLAIERETGTFNTWLALQTPSQ
jgi:tetratricopeptide (TPR) repeat protein